MTIEYDAAYAAEMAYEEYRAALQDPACCCLCGTRLSDAPNKHAYGDRYVHDGCDMQAWADAMQPFELIGTMPTLGPLAYVWGAG